jgi:hypothetical protein
MLTRTRCLWIVWFQDSLALSDLVLKLYVFQLLRKRFVLHPFFSSDCLSHFNDYLFGLRGNFFNSCKISSWRVVNSLNILLLEQEACIFFFFGKNLVLHIEVAKDHMKSFFLSDWGSFRKTHLSKKSWLIWIIDNFNSERNNWKYHF